MSHTEASLAEQLELQLEGAQNKRYPEGKLHQGSQRWLKWRDLQDVLGVHCTRLAVVARMGSSHGMHQG